MGAKSRRKGKAGERELARRLTEMFGVPFKRGYQQRGGHEQPDVTTGEAGEALHIECKRTEALRLYAALDQSTADARPGQVPIVAHRTNGREWVVIVRLDDLPRLAAAAMDMLK